MSKETIIFWICDICGKRVEVRQWLNLVQEGWQKVGTGHYCPDCTSTSKKYIEILKEAIAEES